METPEIKNINGEETVKELLYGLELLQDVRSIIKRNTPTREIGETECITFYNSMFPLMDNIGDLICDISDSIGALASSQIADIYLETKKRTE